MATNPLIPMQAQVADTSNAVYNQQTQQNNNAMSTEQTLKAHYEGMTARDKARLGSTIIGANQLKGFLDTNDLEGAKEFLTRRRNTLRGRMAYGEDIDTEETDYALQAIESGNVDSLKNEINGILAAGQVYGLVDNGQNNAYIQQFRAVKAAHPEWTEAQVQDYVYTRGQVGKSTIFDQNGNVVNQPGAVNAAADMAGGVKYAESTANAAGAQTIANDTTIGNLQNLQQAVNAANTSLAKVAMTGPVFGRAGAAANDPDYINLQRDINEITLLAKDLYNLGSGQGFTDADRDFLRELAGGAYNRAESIQYALNRFSETLSKRQQYLQSRNTQYNQQYGQGQQQQPLMGNEIPNGLVPNTPQGQQGGKITVSNGVETFQIDPADLKAAQAEGFKKQ